MEKSPQRLSSGQTAKRPFALAVVVFTLLTASTASALPPDQGPGGPVLVISNPSNLFTRYYAEILRNEGLNAFAVADIASVSSGTLTAYDVVILGEMTLTGAQTTMLSNWVTAGGNLIAMRPDAALAGLLGITPQGTTLSNAYLLINTASPPGAGLVSQTIQFHGTADRYSVSGATTLATLYSTASIATANPAVTLRSVGSNGGQAAAFTYDLARSIVYTRQGNPAWAGQERDSPEGAVAAGTIRSDDMYYGNAPFDPQPDWVNLDKVAIPQADEQQRLLANLILVMNLDRKPLPRFWYLPRMERAAVLMTGDQHGCCGGTRDRFDTYIDQSPPGCSVADWECVRATSHIYPGGGMTDAEGVSYTNLGFELGVHVDTGCNNWTPAAFQSFFSTQLATFAAQFPSLPTQASQRTHCGAWSDWVSTATVELNNGVRLDTSYYYWPPGWILDRAGMFTGSGMPMRFAQTNGAMVDVYQAATQMTDESGQSYPAHIDELLDNAIGAAGYYGVFTANMHTDSSSHPSSDLIVESAQARSVPVVSGRQMLEWLDGRNNSTFGTVAWSINTLTFTIAPGAGANGLRAMVPASSAAAGISAITRNSAPHAFTTETIKGIEYAVFNGAAGNYVVTYLVPGDTDGDGYAPPADCNDGDDTIFPGAPEPCDGVDNDCDTQIDEPFPLLGDPCSVGLGACFDTGVYVCNVSGTGTVCDAVAGTPTAELCDAIDNDCDGQTDEAFPDLGSPCSVGVGACVTNGFKVCLGNGSGTTCNATPGTPSTEVCDGIDNDCDGSTDEGTSGASCNTGVPGACAAGLVLCQSGVPQCVQQTPATAETCNGIDDDCDASTDEGNPGGGTSCTTPQPGVCAQGTRQCLSGTLQCVAPPPSAETCDGLDNDCDGNTDEGTSGGTCSTGQAECPTGVLVCSGGTPDCDATGIACDDSEACTTGDVCNGASQCVGQPVVCAGATDCAAAETCNPTSGVCEVGSVEPAGTACTDDGDVCTDDLCDGAGACAHAYDQGNDPSCPLCTATPAVGCLEAERVSLQLRDDATDATRNQLRWRWTRGAELMHPALGDPATATVYALCVYDHTAGTPALVASLLVPPSATWRERDPKGWQYKDKTGAFDGTQKIQLKTGSAGRSKTQWMSRGMTVPLPPPASASAFMNADPSVIVQMTSTEGTCFTSEFSSAVRNDTSQFSAKSP